LRIRRDMYAAEASPQHTLDVPVSSVLLKHGQANVLFDTGCHPDAALNAERRWGPMAKLMVPLFKPADSVVGQLPLAGLAPDDIDVVVCSHLHADHCGCNAFFRKATVICHAAELAAARAEDAGRRGYLRHEWDHSTTMDSLDGPRDLFGDGRITLLPMPGHTPGMTTAHVVLNRDRDFLLASDAVPLQMHLNTLSAPANSWNQARAVDAVREISRIEKQGATVLFGHDDDQWSNLRRGAEFYE
jgi:N-acyl homoserine lactone hydrolase